MSPDPRSPVGASWAAVLAAVWAARVTLLLGASDSGKTPLVAVLATALLEVGDSVAVVDADLGQSEIGPPTTVGLGRPRAGLARFDDAEVHGRRGAGPRACDRGRPAGRAPAPLTRRHSR